MSWLYEKLTLDSKQNGRVEAHRLFGRLTVTAQGKNQSSSYTDRMWRKAVAKITKGARVKNILVLGLAGGSCISPLLKKFPHSHITAVEWDEDMRSVFNHFHPKLKSQVSIKVQDASRFIEQEKSRYDLIVFDIYQGNTIWPGLKQPHTLQTLHNLLAPNGYFLCNFWLSRDAHPLVANVFGQQAKWRYALNLFGLFRPQLDDSFERYRACPALVQRENTTRPRGYALRWQGDLVLEVKRLGFFHIAKHIGRTSPDTTSLPKPHVVFWQNTVMSKRPAGWLTWPLREGAEAYGIAKITATPDYFSGWSSHAKRHRKNWLSQDSTQWQIRNATVGEFCRSYKHAKQGIGLPTMMSSVVKYKIKMHGNLCKLYLVEHKQTKDIAAGLCVLDVPECKTSAHIAAFILEAGKLTSAGTGLIDYWYRQSIEQGFEYLDFGVIRSNGEPRDWQGYTDFKTQFLTHTIFQPKPYFQIKLQ